MFADSTMSPMMSMWPAPGVFWRACDRPMPIDESAMAGQKIGTLARYAAVRMPSRSGRLPEMPAEQIQELARRVRPRLERRGEVGNPVVVVDELFLAGVRVVHAIDAIARPAPHRRRAASRRSDAGRAFRAGRDRGSRRSRRGSRRNGARSGARRSAAGRRRDSAPAMPRKIVTSSSSIFCQTRCAVARLRPWNEIRSIRARISSAVRPRFDDERLDRRLQEPRLLRHARTLNHKTAVAQVRVQRVTRDVLEERQIGERRDADAARASAGRRRRWSCSRG